MSKDNQGAIFIASFAEQLIREKVMMDEPNLHWGEEIEFIEEQKKYRDHVASRRTFPYDVKEEQDGKELREGIDFQIKDDHYQNGENVYGIKVAIPIEPETFDVKDGIIQGLEEGAEAWKAEYDNCRTILQELVRCNPIWKKNLLQADVTIAEFTTALEQAKEFLKKYQHSYE